MGCDIHVFPERQETDGWVSVAMNPPAWDFRSYGVFGFLAGVRNYSAVPVIAAPRGFPGDAGPDASRAFECQRGNAHTPSWLGIGELVGFHYDAPMVNRRVTRGTDGGCTGTVNEGIPTTFRWFLGNGYFEDLERMREAGAERVVFWFDS